MRQLSKLGLQIPVRTGYGKEISLVAPCVTYTSNRHSSNIRFLDKTESTSLKRGGGGRSSFSGTVATVFGASGFVGRYVCNRLGKSGTQMIIPYRGDHYQVRHLKLMGDLGQVLFLPFHLRDEESIRKAVKHSDVVINLIGRDWDTRNFTLYETNVEGAARIARISKEMGVKKLIHISALNSNVDHKGYLMSGGSQFLKTKGESEVVVREHFPEAVIFRPSDVYGQDDRFLNYYLKPFRYTLRHYLPVPKAGRGIWKQPVYVGDFAHGIVNAVFDPEVAGNTFEATGPRRYELREFLLWLHRVTRRDRKDKDFKLYNLMFDPVAIFKAMLFEKSLSWPINYFTRDKIEREAISDETFDLPNLEDLGINLTTMEERLDWEVHPFKADMYYADYLGEFEKPAPAPYVKA